MHPRQPMALQLLLLLSIRNLFLLPDQLSRLPLLPSFHGRKSPGVYSLFPRLILISYSLFYSAPEKPPPNAPSKVSQPAPPPAVPPRPSNPLASLPLPPRLHRNLNLSRRLRPRRVGKSLPLFRILLGRMIYNLKSPHPSQSVGTRLLWKKPKSLMTRSLHRLNQHRHPSQFPNLLLSHCLLPSPRNLLAAFTKQSQSM